MRAWMQPAAYFVIARPRGRWAFATSSRSPSLEARLGTPVLARPLRDGQDDAPPLGDRGRGATGPASGDHLARVLAVPRGADVVGERIRRPFRPRFFCSVLTAIPPVGVGVAVRPRLPARAWASWRGALRTGVRVPLPDGRARGGVRRVALRLSTGRTVRSPGARGVGVAAAVRLGLGLVDRWGYGAWCFPAWAYLRINLLDRVASARFGTDPFYGYLYLLPANVFAPVVLVFMLALGLTWVRRPKHPVTWATLPYALVASALAHKEERLLFPMILVATSAVTLGLSPSERSTPVPGALRGVARWGDAVAARVWRLRASPLAWLVVAGDLAGSCSSWPCTRSAQDANVTFYGIPLTTTWSRARTSGRGGGLGVSRLSFLSSRTVAGNPRSPHPRRRRRRFRAYEARQKRLSIS